MHGDRLILAETLIAVLEAGSFSKAAAKLGVSQSTVSRRIASLEARLGGTSLFIRGTRWIDPTQEAEDYVRDIRGVIGQLDAAEAKVRDVTPEPRGVLRVSLPPAIGRSKFLTPIARLSERCRDLSLKIDFSEDYVDLRDGGIDLAVRIRPLEQTGITVEKIGESRIGLYGTPDYLKTAPALKTLPDLRQHRVIGLTSFFERDLQGLPLKNRRVYADIRPAILANDLMAIRSLVLDGLGVSFMPETIVESDLQNGTVVRCLAPTPLPPISFFALYPHGLRNTPRLTAALAALRDAAG